MRKAIFILLAALVLLGCNNRENKLLPPDIPDTYQTGNLIEIYSDYLVNSANDDSYLMLKKNSIWESGIHLGDRIVFARVADFSLMDSLAFSPGAKDVTNAFHLQVMRGDSLIDLPWLEAEVYTSQRSFGRSDPRLVFIKDYLESSPLSLEPYSENRCKFALGSTGMFGVMSLPEGQSITITPSQSAVYTQLKSLSLNQGKQLQINFPAPYLSTAGTIRISYNNNLDANTLQRLKALYPGCAFESESFEISTSAPPTGVAYVKTEKSTKRASKFALGKQWVQMGEDFFFAWQEQDNIAGELFTNWYEAADAYYSFIRGSGKYFFLSPLATQEQMLLPLDGSLNQFFVQELWFDFRAQMFPNLELKLSLRPALAKLKQDYFSGNPFQLSGSQLAYGIELYEGGSLISQLPVDYWIEFGFYAPNADPIARKLFNIYRSPNEDRLSFKTLGSEYDAAYFSFVSDYVYSGIAHSGVYLYTSASEDPLKNIIPYHKAKQSVQLSNSFLSWNDASARGFSHLLLDYSPRRGINHPWLSGQPYTVQGYSQKLSARFHTTSQATDSIPREFFLSFASPNAPKNLYLMNSDAAYPKLKKYEASPAYTAASYVYANGYCSLFPAFGGDIFSGSLSTAQPDNFPVLLYNKMSFDPGEYKIFLHSDSTLPASSILSVRKMSQLPDRYGVLSNQYALSQLSSAWRFTAPYAAFYSQFQPLIFIKELVGKVKARGTDYLFSIYDVDYTYRLYPYPQSSYPDGYHFGYDSGYYSFYLVYDSDYCLMRDLLPHSLATTTISTANTRKILSLYQAQFVLPEYFSGSSLPLGTQIRLQSSAEVPGIPNALVPLRLSFLNSLQQEISPAFFSDPNALEMPLIYVPYNPNSPDDAYHLWFRDLDGTVTELTEVEEFSDNWSTEFIVIGNSALCLVNNPGWFYFTL